MGGQLTAAPSEECEVHACESRGTSGLAGLMQEECVLALLELLDAKSLAGLRRSARMRLEVVADEARMAELRAKILELLESTKFPFTHAAFVLGMNGLYYSLDTLADKHYGIPSLLPRLLCTLFRHSHPGAHFTSIRIQKFSAAVNFGGQHRTLAFNIASPTEADDLPEDQQQALGSDDHRNTSCPHLPGHVLCLPSRGCLGGLGEVSNCAAGADADWQVLCEPQLRSRWVRFPGGAWLRWHWPRAGDLFAITVSCEPPASCLALRRRERREMVEIGFVLPEACGEGEGCSSSDEVEDEKNVENERVGPTEAPQRRHVSRAQVEAARGVLGFSNEVPNPTPQEVDEAFRNHVRAAHPDRSAEADLWSSWRISQLTWARRIMKQAFTEGSPEDVVLPQQPGAELLMLVPPMPALMPPEDDLENDA